MLIGIDGNEANVKERVGVNVWAWELLKELSAHNDVSVRVYLSQPPLSDLPPESANWHYRVIGPKGLWTQWRLPVDLYFHRPRPDVFLSLSHYAPKWAPMPRVVSIMDLSFLEFPEAFMPTVLWQLKNWTKESIKNASRVITISEFNKKEIIKQYGYPAERISVIYPGISEIFKGRSLQEESTMRSAKEKYHLRNKYILFVGTRQKKKNLKRLLEAFELVQNDNPNIELVIAGKIWKQFAKNKKDEILPSMEGSHPSIKYVGFVDEEDLPAVMAGAECLVLPSLYEGFGIPVVEAMSVGAPVIASNISSLQEVIGDAGILFDPHETKDIARAISQALRMTPEQRKQLVKKGMIRAERFTWERAASRVLAVLQII